jgi:Gas vesicle protein K
MQSANTVTVADAGEEVSAMSPEAGEIAGFQQLGRSLGRPGGRLNLDSDTVQHDLARLVLCLVEVIRQLVERQALRRVDGGRLNADQIEKLGVTLMRLEERMDELKEHFGVTGEELNLDLGGLVEEF